MQMNDPVGLVLAAVAGILLGGVFFGGLLWTVRKGVMSSQPATWFLGSFLLRTAIAVAGFYFVARGDWRRSLACLLGFLAARMIVTRLTRVPPDTVGHPAGRNGP
jgi:F1F0 ATPase subunit 2